jgi:WD40 repeat protein
VTWGAFDDGSQRAVTVSPDGTARLWPVAVDTAVGLAAGHEGAVRAVSFSDDGSRFATWSRDGTARVWDAATRSQVASIPTHGAIAVAAMGGPGRSMAIVDDHRLTHYGADGAAVGHVDLSFRPADFEIARGGARMLARGLSGELALFDVASRRLEILDVGGAVGAAAFDTRGDRIAVGRVDGRIQIVDAGRGTKLVELPGHSNDVKRVQFCGDDAHLMSAGNDGTVKLWDLASGDARSVVLRLGISAPLITPGCDFLVAFGEGHPIVVLDARDGQVLDHIDVRSGEALSVAMSADGGRVASVTGDVIWTWDIDVPADLGPLLDVARCALVVRVEGGELVVATPDAKCN